MMSKFEDLQALGRMLDEGKIDRDEYDRLKAELMAEPTTSFNVMEGKPQGWYDDPSGKARHQAYWDGEKWTGETRSQSTADVLGDAQAPSTAFKAGQAVSRGGWKLWLGVIGVVVVLTAIANVCNDGSSPSQGDDGGSSAGHDAVGAYVVCQQFVEDRLTSPASAEYGDTYSQATTHLGGGRYRVETYVDSENAFGATLRTDFTCVVSHVSGDRYRLESLDFDE